LIARQRDNLNLTFTAQEQQPLASQTVNALNDSQKEIAAKTAEFAQGMAARGASIPSLDEAIEFMQAALASLETPELADAVSAEQQALAALIRARQNVRKTLSQSNSQSASECRKFDRQQRQKVRMPEKKKDQQQQLADARQKVNELAQKERKWSEQAQQCCNSSSSKSSSSSASKPSQSSQQQQSGEKDSSSEQQSGDKPTPEEVAAAQEKLQAELDELQQQLDKLPSAGQAAREQAQQAAQSMQKGLDELRRQDGESAAKEGQRSAEQLDQLAAHLAAMGARDFGKRLDQAQQQAQQLASRQESLEKKLGERGGDEKQPGGSPPAEKLARDEQALAAQTEMLADLLDALKRDAGTEKGGVKPKLDQIQAENPPRDIAAGMKRAAEDLQAQRPAQAGRGATAARERLHELARSLRTARSEYAQPQLKELIALEEQLAQLIEQAKRSHEQGQKPTSAEQKWNDLEKRLDALADGDKRLAESLQRLREGPPSKEGEPKSESTDRPATNTGKSPPKPNTQLRPNEFVEGGQLTPEGFYSWLELGDFNVARDVSKVLQTKIQEAILAGALMDADQPVPPAYKELVEKYYRALSDDLR
jgi:hypothetical protein